MGRQAILSIVVLVSMFAAGCLRKVDDATLATQIKSQMFSDPQLNGSNLEVTSKEVQVTLAGTVPNDAARYKAYKIASETADVTSERPDDRQRRDRCLTLRYRRTAPHLNQMLRKISRFPVRPISRAKRA
jgi:hypothetical protein